MKKISVLSLCLMLVLTPLTAQAVGWDKAVPAVSDYLTSWPEQATANYDALDSLLASYRQGITLTYSSASTVIASAGSITVSNTAGTVRVMLKNDSSTNITFSNIDTGAEASSTTYYVYAVATATTDTAATFKISASSTSPNGITVNSLSFLELKSMFFSIISITYLLYVVR